MFKLEFIGNVCQDATIKEFNGRKLLAFTVAVNEYYTDQQGQKHEKTTYVSCLKSVFNEQSTLGMYLKQGVKIWVSGTPSVRGYTKDNVVFGGQNCKVNDLELLTSKRTGNTPEAHQSAPTVQNTAQPQRTPQTANSASQQAGVQPQERMPTDPDGDLPF